VQQLTAFTFFPSYLHPCLLRFLFFICLPNLKSRYAALLHTGCWGQSAKERLRDLLPTLALQRMRLRAKNLRMSEANSFSAHSPAKAGQVCLWFYD